MSDSQDNEKKSFRSRVGQYGKNRLLIGNFGKLSKSLANNEGGALDVLKPKKIDKEEAVQAFQGRYADGGRKAFEDLAGRRNYSDEDLEKRANQFQIAAYVAAVATLALVVGISAWPMMSDGLFAVVGTISFATTSVFLASMTVKYDYAAWQIRQRRFGSLKDYFATRFS